MSTTNAPAPRAAPWDTLRRFASQRRSAATERCELCGEDLATDHAHLVEPGTRNILCACDACAILFSQQADTRYRRVRRDARYLGDFRLDDAQWDALSIPIGLAFFYRNSKTEKIVALYPSPGGPMESTLDLAAWDDVARENPVLTEMEPDTQALLVNRLHDARDCFLAPIDECYRLVGLVRARWKGINGGDEVWEEIRRFFEHLKQRST